MRSVWHTYYWRRRLFYMLWLVFPLLWLLPAIALTGALETRGLNGGWLELVTIGLLPLALFVWAYCPCPRCRKPIHVWGLLASNLFSRRCIHCHMKVGNDSNETSADAATSPPSGTANCDGSLEPL
jgi:hypothetical protein